MKAEARRTTDALTPGTRLGRYILADVIGWAIPNSGVGRIAVTQDEEPLLLMVGGVPVSLSVYDARSGEFLRDVPNVGFFAGALQVP